MGISTFTDVRRFFRNYWARLVTISFVVCIPCLWHPRIEAGDLPSHVYNAWIFHLIKAGQAPGLWLARRWNNVLFDLVLSGLGNVVSWGAAEKIATCGAVLIFFLGSVHPGLLPDPKSTVVPAASLGDSNLRLDI